jgi:hypothetical protein
MEQDFGLDLEEAARAIDTAEVLIVRFKIIEPRLMVDSRARDGDGPMIRLVPRASSVEERFRNLKELRPAYPLPDRILSFEWPRHVQTIEAAGLWQKIEQRLESAGGSEAKAHAARVFRELLAAERREEVAAIRGGDGYQTLWERS